MSADAGPGGPRVLVRADAGPRIGSGHLTRSLALAGALADRGARTRFVVGAGAGGLAERVRRAGHELEVIAGPGEALPADGPWGAGAQREDLDRTLAAAGGWYDLVVVDHYGLDREWHRGVRARTGHVTVLDDLADRAHDADVLVDHNWYGPHTATRYDGLVGEGCLQLLGPRYAPLQASYARARPRAVPRAHPPRRVLVSFGGADPTGETVKVLEALDDPDFDHLHVDVVAGTRATVTGRLERLVDRRPRTVLHVELPTLAGLLARADLAFGASGSATWERLCLGVPAIVATTRESQSGVTRALADAGLTVWAGLGESTDPDRYRKLLRESLARPALPAPPVVDGWGAPRVAAALVPGAAAQVGVRRATGLDAPVFCGCDRGAPAGCPRALDGPGVWLREERRFRADLGSVDVDLLVVTAGEVPVGRARASGDAVTALVLDDAVAGGDLEQQARALLRDRRWLRAGSA